MQAYDLWGNLNILSSPDKPKDSLFNYIKHKEYRTLKAATGQDFGFDVEQWRSWLENHKAEYLKGMQEVIDLEFENVEILGYPDDPGDTEFNHAKQRVYQRYKDITGQDFGRDVANWVGWLTEHRDIYNRAMLERKTRHI